MLKASYVVALMIVGVILLSVAGYLAFYHGTSRTTSNTQNAITTTTTNGSPVYVYPTSNLSSAISARLGETFGVQLSSNAGSTGYDWNVSSSSGIQFINYTVVSTSTLVGGPEVRDYWFRASQAGNQSITLRDERQFSPHDVYATIQLLVTMPSTGFQSNLDTLAGGGAQLAMLSYNFQVNSTGGTLFVVFKDYSNSSTVMSSIRFDNGMVSNSSIEYSGDCGNFQPESECGVTLIFGVGALPMPAENSNHSLEVLIGSGESFDFTVVAGLFEHADCTYSSSC
ncbi:MAG: protease inhibitor I42 family protein [Nitrososphaerota archaeon]|nr:protease inhibitor I42 family protein [Nitrososphaerota archaeon]MDG6924195.1 protease inhibitor I42 family protein [Nitrososphaerota archaeon]